MAFQVPIAVRLLASASSDLQDHAAWLLANIACESCSHVLEAGALAPLLKLLDESKQETASEQSLVKTGTWLLSNLCQCVVILRFSNSVHRIIASHRLRARLSEHYPQVIAERTRMRVQWRDNQFSLVGRRLLYQILQCTPGFGKGTHTQTDTHTHTQTQTFKARTSF